MKNLSRPEKSSFLHEGAKKVCGRHYVLRDHTNHCLKQWVYDHKSNFHNTQELGGELPNCGWWLPIILRVHLVKRCCLSALLANCSSATKRFAWLRRPIPCVCPQTTGCAGSSAAVRLWVPRLPSGLGRSISMNWNDGIFPQQMCFGCWSWITGRYK